MNLFFLAGALLAGICFALQGPVNTALGKRTGPLQASAVSFLGGTVILLVLVLVAGHGDLSRIREAALWQVVGGACGAFGVAITVMSIPVLGAALAVIAVQFGQILTGAVIDAFGLFGTEPIAVSTLRILGMAAVALGIILIYRGGLSASQNASSRKQKALLMLILSFVSGIFSSIQSPINASLAGLVGNLEATFISFVVGFAVLAVLLLIVGKGKLQPMRGVGIKPWMVAGGAFGVLGIFLNLYVVPVLGVALQVACGMTGQLTASLLVDSFGLIHTPKVRITRLRLIGVVVIAIGVVLTSLGQ